ncbi:hypothetical protein [uncultured Anaerotruncus sp.]|uniref:hypothetical protein n=1 Tax=uncultured Anaerotruncus sp. TaxID=905011 RepID=UPI00280B4C26|nr:hypothetical protein [uncultured Anaerotruncus sp.]
MNYAIIQNGVVVNVIVIAPYNTSDFPDAVPVGDKPVGIGDEYRDGRFWRNGTEVLSSVNSNLSTSESQGILKRIFRR